MQADCRSPCQAMIQRHRDAHLVLLGIAIASPMKKPLLRILWWVSVAPFGAPVVPEVNWMLIGSSNCSSGEAPQAAGMHSPPC